MSVRIVYFIDHLRRDGTQRVLQQLVQGLAAHGHYQAIVCLNDSFDAALVAELRASGAEVRIVGRAGLLAGYGLLTLVLWLRHRRFDVAVTLLFAADVIGRAIAHASGIPRLISSIRARNSNYSIWQRLLINLTMPLADTVVVNSAAVADVAIAAEGADPAGLVVIPNGVDVEQYQHAMSRDQLRKAFGLAPGRRVIGSVGRLEYQKGFDILLEACAALPQRNWDLLLIGEGSEKAQLQQQAASLGIQECVHLVGYRRDVPLLLGALDLYVHPARFEGMPNALLEAMAAGCPIVASAADGNRELISDDIHGWLVPVADVPLLTQTIQAALSDRVTTQRFGAAAARRARETFSVDTMIDSWERLIATKPVAQQVETR